MACSTSGARPTWLALRAVDEATTMLAGDAAIFRAFAVRGVAAESGKQGSMLGAMSAPAARSPASKSRRTPVPSERRLKPCLPARLPSPMLR